MSLDNFKPLAIELGGIIEQIRDLTARKKELEEQLRPQLLGRGAVQFDDYQYQVTQVAGRKTIDKDAMKDAGINIDDYMKQGAPYTKMVCKKVERI